MLSNLWFYFSFTYTTTNRRLLKALGGCNGDMRSKVPGRYFQMYHKDLLSLMKSECGSRHFGTALQYLAVDPVHAECLMIEDACKGFGTNEIFLFSIICGRSNKDIELLKVCVVIDFFENLRKDLNFLISFAFHEFIDESKNITRQQHL